MLDRAKLLLASTLLAGASAGCAHRVSTYACCSSTWTYRDFYLDWAPVDVFYGA